MPIESQRPSGRPGPPATGQLGMIVLFVSLSVLFVAATLAVLITSHQVPAWRSPDNRGVPLGTAASTALLGVVSWQFQAALRAIRSNRFTSTLARLRFGTGAALAFLVVQAWNVHELFELEGTFATRTLFVFSYDLLVGLHAAHVLGGFVPLGVVYGKVVRRDYSSSRHAGFAFCVQYWHYLGVVWLLLLGALVWVG